MESITNCMHCSHERDAVDLHHYNDEELIVCTYCSRFYSACTDCNNMELSRDLIGTFDGYVCNHCIDNYTECDHCNNYILIDDACEFDDTYLCESCYDDETFECYSCSERYYNDNSYSAHGDMYCESCFDDRFTHCEDCGDAINRDDSHCTENGAYCESCFDNNSIIHDHSYTPRPHFYTVERGDLLHIGLEYEVYNKEGTHNNTSMAESIQDNFPEFYFKDDSSINNGFEIVSHPCTLTHHNSIDYEKLVNLLKEHGFSSDSKNGSCGVHVHLSRDWIEKNCSSLTSVKYGLFLKSTQRFAKILARRQDSSWSSFDTIDKQQHIDMTKQGKKPYHCSKYAAVNYQHTSTIETRIFAGTIRSYRLLAAMEFCHSVVNHVNNIGYTSINFKHDFTLWAEYVQYVKSHGRLYKNLLKNMNEFQLTGV